MYDMIARLAELMAELAEEMACPASDQGVHQTQLSRIQDELACIVVRAEVGRADAAAHLADFNKRQAKHDAREARGTP